MKLIDLLIDEFAHETRTTRPHLERLPNDKLDWRPHTQVIYGGRAWLTHRRVRGLG